jgi:hypothetical protein
MMLLDQGGDLEEALGVRSRKLLEAPVEPFSIVVDGRLAGRCPQRDAITPPSGTFSS